MKQKIQSGFTLIELIAVMVILAILAAVVIPRITTVQEGAYESNVINMYGAIKNYIANEALKNAISGGRGMETYTNPGQTGAERAANYYLDLWIKDYDADKWSSTSDNNDGDTGNTPGNVGTAGTPGNIVFKYDPHGIGQGVLKDIYWIEYFPCTSTAAALDNYAYDTYQLIAYKDRNTSGEDQDDGDFTATSDVTRNREREIAGAIINGP